MQDNQIRFVVASVFNLNGDLEFATKVWSARCILSSIVNAVAMRHLFSPSMTHDRSQDKQEAVEKLSTWKQSLITRSEN